MNVIIIGAGTAGCEAAYRLAKAGFTVELVEKECTPGGNLNNWFQLFPDRKQASALRQLLQQQVEHPSIRLHTDTVPVKIERQDARHYAMELDNGARLEGNALLVTTGFRTFDASRKEEYGYGIYENVITSVELENYFANRQILTSTGKRPERIGLIQCVGSRDEKMCNFHCSKVCCITAVKQAMELRELLPDAEILCFYMDMRMFGPGYEEMYREAQEKYNIKFVRGRLSEASENQAKQVVVKCEDTLVGKPMRMTLDLMVLMVGMEASDGSRWVAKELQLPLAPNGFIQPGDPHYATNRTVVEGVFVAGCATSPMNLTDTLTDARSAALAIGEFLNGNEHYN